MLASVVALIVVSVGCEKDTDCKGDRVCDDGRCVAPIGRAEGELPPPPPMPPPLERAPLRNPSAQPMDAQGRPTPEYRVAPVAAPPIAPTNPPIKEPRARAVGLIAAMYGGMFAVGKAVPAFAFTGAVGVRFSSGVGIVAVTHGTVFVGPNGAVQFYGFGPGLRFGNRTQVTLSVTGTYVSVSTASVQVGGLAFSALAQLVFVFGDHFSLLVQPAIHADHSGIIGTLTGGLGVTF